MGNEALEGALAGALEEALITVYERDREMFDADALAAIDALVALWQPGEETADPQALSYWAFAAYEAMCPLCDSFAGRDVPYDVEDVSLSSRVHEDDAPREILSAAEVTAVLQQLRASVEYWQESGGLRGFYESIRE